MILLFGFGFFSLKLCASIKESGGVSCVVSGLCISMILTYFLYCDAYTSCLFCPVILNLGNVNWLCKYHSGNLLNLCYICPSDIL